MPNPPFSILSTPPKTSKLSRWRLCVTAPLIWTLARGLWSERVQKAWSSSQEGWTKCSPSIPSSCLGLVREECFVLS